MNDKEYYELVELAENKGLSGKENIDLYISLGMDYNSILKKLKFNTTGRILKDKNGFKGSLFDYSKLYNIGESNLKYHLNKYHNDIDKVINILKSNEKFIRVEIDGEIIEFDCLNQVLKYLDITKHQWAYYRRYYNKTGEDLFYELLNNKPSLFEFRGEKEKLSYFIKKYNISNRVSKLIKNNFDLKFQVEKLEKIRKSKKELKTNYGEIITIEELNNYGVKRKNAVSQINRGWNKNKILNNLRGKEISENRNKTIRIENKIYTLKELKALLSPNSISNILKDLSLTSLEEYYIKYFEIHKEIIQKFDLQYVSLSVFYNRLIKIGMCQNINSLQEFYDEISKKIYLDWNFEKNELDYIQGKIDFRSYENIINNVSHNNFKFKYDNKIFKTKASLCRYIGFKNSSNFSFDPIDDRFRTFINYKGDEIALARVLYNLGLSSKIITLACKFYNDNQINTILLLYSTKNIKLFGKEFDNFHDLSKEYKGRVNHFIGNVASRKDFIFNEETLIQNFINFIQQGKSYSKLTSLEYSYTRKDLTQFKSNKFKVLAKEFYETSPSNLRKYLLDNNYDVQKFYDEEYAPLRIYFNKENKMCTLKLKEFSNLENVDYNNLTNYYKLNKNAQEIYNDRHDINNWNVAKLENKYITLNKFLSLDLNLKFDPEISFNMLKSGVDLKELLK